MSYYLGIDLGSTTSKAVLIDENEEVCGRGLTNTRCNYTVATEIAKTEAINNARFSILRRSLESAMSNTLHVQGLLDELDGRFRVEQQLCQLESLEESCIEIAPEKLRPMIRDVFIGMRKDAVEVFKNARADHSRFFRDLAGSCYYSVANQVASSTGTSFDQLVGVYDKAILLVENQVIHSDFGKTASKALSSMSCAPDGECACANSKSKKLDSEETEIIQNAINEASSYPINIIEMVGTGYGRARLPFEKHQIRSEILCHGLGAHFLYPHTRTVLDIGGQDTKAIQIDEKGIVTSFQMNDRCAAGCGRYLGYIADELKLGLHEIGPLSLKADRTCQICSTCTVFAGAELRDLLSLGEKQENILSGLHKAIILRAMSLLARSGGVENEFTFTGGVAKNSAVVKALKDLVEENYGERTLNIHPDSIYTGAIGAALYGHRAIDLEETGKCLQPSA